MICSPCNSSTELSVSPVRPRKLIMGVQDHDGWENLRDVPVEALDVDARELVDNDDEVDAESGEVARVPRGLPEPSEPTAAMRARHNLTHWPYRSWCEHCVAARRANTKHPHSPSSDRTVPVFVSDYCFLRDSRDEDLATCFVGKIYPSRNMFASIVDCKGSGDELAVKQLANFFRENGVTEMVCKTDQDHAVKSYVDDAIRQAGVSILVDDDAVLEAVPEYSAVGESASNGKAERAVQMLEDKIRTLKSALEARIKL